MVAVVVAFVLVRIVLNYYWYGVITLAGFRLFKGCGLLFFFFLLLWLVPRLMVGFGFGTLYSLRYVIMLHVLLNILLFLFIVAIVIVIVVLVVVVVTEK